MPSERAFAILGPDTVAYGHCGEVMQELEQHGKVVNAEMRTFTPGELDILMRCGPRRGRALGGQLDHSAGKPVLCLVLEGEKDIAEQISDVLGRLQVKFIRRYYDLCSDDALRTNDIEAFMRTDLYAPAFPERAGHAISVAFHDKTFDVPGEVPHLPDPKDIPPTNLGKFLRPSQFAAAGDRTLAILKPDTVIQRHCGEILEIAENIGHITALRMVQMTREQLQRHLGHVSHLHDFEPRIKPFMELPMIPFILKGPHMIGVWRAVSGPTNSADARALAPETIRALYGTDETINAIHGSGDAEEAAAESQNFFGEDQIFDTPRPSHQEQRLRV